MRKILRSNNGFAMTELLIASAVILGIFALLFANFLPLMAEYENRENYNNVTSKYAAFYLRKMYINALEDSTSGIDKKVDLNENIAKDGKNYFEAYDGKEDKFCPRMLVKDQELCKSIIKEYNIEKIIVTNYKIQDLKKTYPKDGTFSGYIKNLPIYKNKDINGKELYRLIIKTREYGYATTQILSDYQTNTECLEGRIKDNGELELTKYLYDDKNCSSKVVLPNNKVTIKDRNGNSITGVITSIGEGAFKDKKIEGISYPISIREIKAEAFKNTKLSEFKFNTTLTSIGKEAFANTNINSITIPNYVSIGDYAFKDNNNLTSIILDSGIKSIMTNNNTITKGLFENCGDGNEVTLSVPTSMQFIGDSMFNNTYIKNLDFGSTYIKVIGDNAFKTNNNKKVSNFSMPNTLTSIGNYAFSNNKINIVTIPIKTRIIGSHSFENSGIKTLTINSKEDVVINSYAFSNNEIETLKLDKITQLGSYSFKDNKKLRSLTIPSTLVKIGNGSFVNCSLLGEKQDQVKTYKNNINWCRVFYDKDNCKETKQNNIIKIESDNVSKYITTERVGGLLD